MVKVGYGGNCPTHASMEKWTLNNDGGGGGGGGDDDDDDDGDDGDDDEFNICLFSNIERDGPLSRFY